MTNRTIAEAYPSIERFEEILEEAAMTASTLDSKQFVHNIRQAYREYGAQTLLSDHERVALRRIATGVLA